MAAKLAAIQEATDQRSQTIRAIADHFGISLVPGEGSGGHPKMEATMVQVRGGFDRMHIKKPDEGTPMHALGTSLEALITGVICDI